MKPSILRNLGIAFIGFGLLMGIIFPFYAQFFVEWKPGMQSWFIVGCLVAGITIGAINYWLINVVLLRKLHRISTVANAISNKDITFQCHIESHDVIGEIVNSFNRMALTLRDMLSRLNAITSQLSDAAGDLSTFTHNSAEHIQGQQRETQHVVHAIEEMTHTIQRIAAHAADATEAADSAQSHSNTGRQVVNSTISSINRLADEIERAAGVVDTLAQDSQAIGGVLDVIRGIADQTNLLALNAAIEAARAGESGRGFAVVADEVRSLATRTQQSTQEIQGMIERLRTGADDAVNAMHSSREQAKQSVNQASEAGGALQAITAAVGNIHQMNRQITDSSDQQLNVSQQINHTIHTIEMLTNESANISQQITAANSELDSLASQIRQMLGEYKT
ncbi:MAG: methyl-accepting chemotaxis protein [Gammaproteobacteria bacterium]|nr:methyl-accepting chemotaxis protein [Gammaproteobacteria bacterium]